MSVRAIKMVHTNSNHEGQQLALFSDAQQARSGQELSYTRRHRYVVDSVNPDLEPPTN